MRHSLAAVALALASCSSPELGPRDSFGFEKRDLLVARVEDGRDAERAAKAQFEAALDALRAIDAPAADQAASYAALESAYESSSDRSDDLAANIRAIEQVAGELFAEWRAEIDQSSDAGAKSSELDKLASWQRRCGRLTGALDRVQSRLEPTLAAFRERVLLEKQDLAAPAAATERDASVEADVRLLELVRELDAAILETAGFVKSIEAAGS
jgi:hypothetical protein